MENNFLSIAHSLGDVYFQDLPFLHHLRGTEPEGSDKYSSAESWVERLKSSMNLMLGHADRTYVRQKWHCACSNFASMIPLGSRKYELTWECYVHQPLHQNPQDAIISLRFSLTFLPPQALHLSRSLITLPSPLQTLQVLCSCCTMPGPI